MALPQYARDVPRERLVRVFCKGDCGMTRYAELSKTPWSKEGFDSELYATCLVCGREAKDNYNWYKA